MKKIKYIELKEGEFSFKYKDEYYHIGDNIKWERTKGYGNISHYRNNYKFRRPILVNIGEKESKPGTERWE